MAKTKITSGGIGTGAVSSDDLAGSVANAKLANSSLTYNSQTVALGASGTIDTYTDVLPTFTSTTPSVATNDLTSLVIAGTNFGSSGIPAVEFQNSTGVITAASSVVRDSATQLTVGCTLPTDGTYFIRIELNNGLAVRSTTAVLTISDAPVWSTAADSVSYTHLTLPTIYSV